MGSEFWEIAEPFIRIPARGITYGPELRYKKFAAVMVALGHPLEKVDCAKCVSDGLAKLKSQHRLDFNHMAKGQTCKLKDLSFTWRGIKYYRETVTDEVARDMLSVYPNHAIFFEKLPDPVKPQAKKKVKEGKE